MRAMYDRRKSDEDRGLFSRLLEQLGAGVFRNGLVPGFPVGLKNTVGSGSPRMNDPLRNAFTVKVGNLLQVMVIFQRTGPPATNRSDVLVVRDRMPLTGRQRLARCGEIGARFAFLIVIQWYTPFGLKFPNTIICQSAPVSFMDLHWSKAESEDHK